ncbi:glycosyltransferase [Lichenibacterium minor]|jgi:glycosyltransferase involved in cell wall biosynthesis|uniref:Glycosyltransferase n=1 Tax=Lichenibacterium minor TaxID=2316528 RepID=A0A4Q2U763_9HYPH|nr:glycosyltransferase family 4 protein [Lichenibacterium minor]RYC30746.1 glycosyltransferase [Lichenibacterium minor]
MPQASPKGSEDLAGATVLQIIPSLDAGGAERTTIDIAGALVEAGGRALVASRGGRLVSELQARGGIWIPFPAGAKNPAAMAWNVGRLARLIRLERPAVVHARSRAPAWVALGAARLTGVPFMTTFHGAYGGTSALKLRYNSVMARGDVVIANSDYTRGLVTSLYPWAVPQVEVVHRGTDLRQFAPAAVAPARVQKLRSDWGVEVGDRVVLLAARLTSWKGHRVLIEAARLLKAAGLADTSFILAGDPQGRDRYAAELDAAVDDAGLRGVVKRVGHVADMPAAFLAASVVAVPSTKPEAFGRSAVEAQAMGTPVVVSDHGAVPETVLSVPRVAAEARTGWCVPPDDARALALAIGEALALGASARDGMARRAQAHVAEHFSLERMEGATLALYRDVIAGRRRAASTAPSPQAEKGAAAKP